MYINLTFNIMNFYVFLENKASSLTIDQPSLYNHISNNKYDKKIMKPITREVFYNNVKSLRDEVNRVLTDDNLFFKTLYLKNEVYVRCFKNDNRYGNGYIVIFKNGKPGILDVHINCCKTQSSLAFW